MRARILVLALTVMSVASACSIDVLERDESGWTLPGEIAVYPHARRVQTGYADSVNVSFTGSFATTRVVPQKFVSDDAPAMVLDFYRRAAMRSHTELIQCRGGISIRRSRGAEKPECIEIPSSPAVLLATGTRPYYRVVAVEPRGSVTEFTLVSVYVR